MLGSEMILYGRKRLGDLPHAVINEECEILYPLAVGAIVYDAGAPRDKCPRFISVTRRRS